jgi:hypothetical protein
LAVKEVVIPYEPRDWTVLVAFEGEHPIIFDSYEEQGSELKKLSPDYDFYYAKRIWIGTPGVKKTFSSNSSKHYSAIDADFIPVPQVRGSLQNPAQLCKALYISIGL